MLFRSVIYASGFAETGDAHLQKELLEAADGMPLMGPNCYGFVNCLARVAPWPDEHSMEIIDKGVAIITQSGNIACNFTFTRRALPLACIFAIGNQADIDMAQMLEALAHDERITAIGLHIEGLTDVAAFARAAEVARSSAAPTSWSPCRDLSPKSAAGCNKKVYRRPTPWYSSAALGTAVVAQLTGC